MGKGEIWIIDIPEGDGSEQYWIRPVIIIAELEANIAVIIPFTSNIRAFRFPNIIAIEPDESNGLIITSIALIFQIRTIDRKRLIKKI